jgi:late competence protein required for DNA uptake (superfamily II DNA/RNA helicase)
MTNEKHICCRCKKAEAIDKIILPVREEEFWLCRECLLMVMELVLRWMDVPRWNKVLWDYEKELKP